MAKITLDHIRHAYGPARTASDYALKELDIVWTDGGAFALLGPSGCGKTTLLNIISGLITPSEGRVLFDDRDVTTLPPEARNIAQVFQFPVVYDTMTVRQNLAFPLKNRGVPKAEIDARVARILDMLGLTALADRRAESLTADLKQKISLGRGMVREDVAAILFDEPLTVIDPHLKWQLRAQLKTLHREFGHTMVYVTHDQTEALTFADKVVVMYDGEVVQVGTPQELFERPAHTFVGYFIGSPGMNVLPVTLNGATASLGTETIALPGGAATRAGAKTELGIRPEFVTLGAEGLPFTVTRVDDIGREKIVHGTLGGHPLAAILPEGTEVPAEPRAALRPRRHQHLRRRLARGDGRMNKTVNNRAWFLVLPVLLLVAMNAIIPLMTVVNYSLQESFIAGFWDWVGTRHYVEVLHSERFHGALIRQLIFTGIILLIEIPLGVAVALAMPKKGAWASVCLVLMALPLLIPWNVVGAIWNIFALPEIGLLGWGLNELGINYNYTNQPLAAWFTVILMDVWHWTSLVVLLAYAGLQSIDDAYYRAAKIDGASRWAVFRFIQLPKLRTVLIIAVLLRFIDSFMIYTEPFVLTGGGPGNATTFLSIDLVKAAVGEFNLGIAAAMSIIYFLMTLLVCWLFFTLMNNDRERQQ